MWWRKVAATSSGAAGAAAARVVDDAMLLHNGVWGLVRSVTGQKAAQTVAIDEVHPRSNVAERFLRHIAAFSCLHVITHSIVEERNA